MDNINFNIKHFWTVKLGEMEIVITETIFNTWIIMLVLITFAVIVRIRLRKFNDRPSGFQNVVEMMVEAFDNFVRGCVGNKFMYLGNWFFMVFSFIFISNISGLFSLRPPTADWAMTFTFAISTFFLIHITAFRSRKGKYAKSFLEPNPLFLPLNLIGELARPISLSFRLFGNVLAGMILMTLLYSAPMVVRFGLPSALHAYFDLFAGVLQTYIFCVLSLSFIGVASEAEVD